MCICTAKQSKQHCHWAIFVFSLCIKDADSVVVKEFLSPCLPWADVECVLNYWWEKFPAVLQVVHRYGTFTASDVARQSWFLFDRCASLDSLKVSHRHCKSGCRLPSLLIWEAKGSWQNSSTKEWGSEYRLVVGFHPNMLPCGNSISDLHDYPKSWFHNCNCNYFCRLILWMTSCIFFNAHLSNLNESLIA